MSSRCVLVVSIALVMGLCSFAAGDAIIFVDYSFDTQNFFNTQQRRDALQAAANRWASIINSPLTAVGPSGTATGTGPGWRIGFTHPGTGANFEYSTALNAGSDPIVGAGAPPASQYGFAGLPANTWILYAGGRALGSAGIGGTGTGINFETTFNDIQGPLHRGVISNTLSDTFRDLPAWGGSISFNTGTTWHFDPSTPAPSGTVDFYSIALHEIGHALGLSADWNQWTRFVSGSVFNGPEAVAAYNADNGTSLTGLNMVSTTNFHWQDGVYDSRIFAAANPNYVGTVGEGNLQDLLMEPTANFTGTLRRFEVTNVEVGALRDLGWSAVGVPEASTILYLGGAVTLVSYVYSRRKTKQPAPAAEENAASAA